jgi:hypothetical protein
VSQLEPPFEHLHRLSDDTGLLEHARGAVPRREHGYCLDDVARGLVVICREPSPSPALVSLAERYLAFVNHAQAANGQCHNRLGYDRRWADEPGLGDWWGRSLWASGTAAVRGPSARLRADALTHFEAGARCRAGAPRTMAFAALGAAQVLTGHPGHDGALDLLRAAAQLLARPRPASGRDPRTSGSGDWPWPEPRLAYANAAWAEALMAAGWGLHDDELTGEGIRLLEWLLTTETAGEHLSLTPTGGWGRDDPRPGFDQQPIEAAALADACGRAFGLTGDERFAGGVARAVAWFLGENDAHTPMFDPSTGGGYDGLEPDGRNENQGAESTIALISTFQQGVQLAQQRPAGQAAPNPRRLRAVGR